MLLYYNMQKNCGFCGESIPAAARRCPYCGSVLDAIADENFNVNMETEEGSKQPYSGPGWDGAGQPVQDPAKDTQAGQNMPGSVNEGQKAPAETGEPYGTRMGTGPQTEQWNQYRYVPQPGYGRTPLSNGMKVFLTVLFTLLPGIGQLAGIITAIVFMSSEGDSDRKSFGVALLVNCVVLFMLSCTGCFIFSIVAQSMSK
jgi:hypothetical protein